MPGERQARTISGCIVDGHGRGGILLAFVTVGLVCRTIKGGVVDSRRSLAESCVPLGPVRHKVTGGSSHLERYPDLDSKVAVILEGGAYGAP